MKTKIILLFIFFGLIVKSQEYKKYDFEKQVRFVFDDSSYTAMEIAVNNHLIFEPYYKKYVEKNIVPLKFIMWKKREDHKKNNFEDFIEGFSSYFDKQKKHSDTNIFFDFSFIEPSTKIERASGADYYFISYANDVGIRFRKNINENSKIEYFLKTFCIGKISTPYDRTVKISKIFSSKSHVFTDEFLNNCEKCNIEKIIYSNKTTISSENIKENVERFNILIYDRVEKNHNDDPLLIARKVIITGSKNEAIDYLKKNNLDYQEVSSENIKEEDSNDLD